MALAAIIVSGAGAVLSFILGFPLGMFLGPPIGIVFGVVGLVLAMVADKRKKPKLKLWAVIVSAAVLGISIARLASLLSCAGRMSGILGALMSVTG